MYENMATPETSINAVKILSKSLLGLKSPKPTVESEVKAKYITIMVVCVGSKLSMSLYSMKNSWSMSPRSYAIYLHESAIIMNIIPTK